MKKRYVFLLTALMLLSLSACKRIDTGTVNSNTSSTASMPESAPTSSNVSKVEGSVSKDGEFVEVALPANLVGDDQIGELTNEQIASGFQSSKVNEDGSITYRIDQSKYDAYVESIKNELIATLNEMAGSGDYPSIEEVKFSTALDEVTLLVDQEKYKSSTDKYATKGVGLKLATYQLLSGKPMSEVVVIVNVENAETNEVFDSMIYPEIA